MGCREPRHLGERRRGRATAGKSAPGSPGGLIGGKDDGSRGRANGSRWGAKQSWAQDRRREEGGCRGRRPEGQGPWEGTDGCRRGGDRAGQEAGCQRLGELLLQGQFRLQRREERTQVSDPRKILSPPWAPSLGFLLRGEKCDCQDSKPKSSSLPTPKHSFQRAFSTTCLPAWREENLRMGQGRRLWGAGVEMVSRRCTPTPRSCP